MSKVDLSLLKKAANLKRGPMGAGSSKKKSSSQQRQLEVHQPIETPDNLKSNTIATIIDVISEGPIQAIHEIYANEGPVNYQSVTPLVNAVFRNGTENQLPLDGYPASSEVTDMKDLDVNRRNWNKGPSIYNSEVDRVSFTVRVGGLFSTSSHEATRGDIRGNTVQFWLGIFDASGTLVVKIKKQIRGKTTSGQFNKTFNVDVPDTAVFPLQPAIYKIGRNQKSSAHRNDIYWAFYTAFIDEKINYRHTAVVGMEVSARRYPGIPDRAYDISGRIIRVPSNRNNDVDDGSYRAYTGDWDGTFVLDWTDNPAWIIYDLLTHPRYGLGHLVQDTFVDKWQLYQIGVYCDEGVPSGEKDNAGFDILEPRFTCNVRLESQEEALEFLMEMLSTINAQMYWSGGQLRFTQDTIKDRIHLFTPTNVLGGSFYYEGPELNANHSIAHVAWSNPERFGQQDFEVYEDEARIQRFGERVLQVTAFGTTSRGQARRIGKWAIETEKRQSDVLGFSTGLEGALLRPGDVIGVVDPDRNAARQHARMSSSGLDPVGGGTTIELDREVTLDSGSAYNLYALVPAQDEEQTLPGNSTSIVLAADPPNNDWTQVVVYVDTDNDGDYTDINGEPDHQAEVQGYDSGTNTLRITEPVASATPIKFKIIYPEALVPYPILTAAGTTSRIEIAASLTLERDTNLIIEDTTNVPIEDYVCVMVKEDEPHQYTVRALKYDPLKFAAVESGIIIEDPEAQFQLPTATTQAPQNLTATLGVRITNSLPQLFVDLEWDPSQDLTIRGYKIVSQFQGGAPNLEEVIWTDPNYQVNVTPGSWEFFVTAIDLNGQESAQSSVTVNVTSQTGIDLVSINTLEVDKGSGGPDEFVGPDATFTWTVSDPTNLVDGADPLDQSGAITAGSTSNSLVDGVVVQVLDAVTDRIYREETVRNLDQYVYSYTKNLQDGGPRRKFKFQVAAMDIFGNVGSFTKITVENEAPGQVSGLRLTPNFDTIWVEYDVPEDLDLAGLLVWMDTQSNFTPSATNLVHRGLTKPLALPAARGTTHYLRVAAFDGFSEDPDLLNVSAELVVDTLLIDGNFDIEKLSIGTGVIGQAVIGQANVARAIIDTAQIKDLAVDTLQIAGNAVTKLTEFESLRAFEMFPSTPQGTWGNVGEISATTTGGPVLVTAIQFAEVVAASPTPLTQSSVAAVTFLDNEILRVGQRAPRVSYRVIRDIGTPNAVTVFETQAQSISMAMYSLSGIVTRLDQPPPGFHTWRIQYLWNLDVYDSGMALYQTGTSVFGVGTRWTPNTIWADNTTVASGIGANHPLTEEAGAGTPRWYVGAADQFRYMNVGGAPGAWSSIHTTNNDKQLTLHTSLTAPDEGTNQPAEYQIRRPETWRTHPNNYALYPDMLANSALTMDVNKIVMQVSESRR